MFTNKCTKVNKFHVEQPGGTFLQNLVLDLILIVKSTNGNLMNHYDPLLVLKGVQYFQN